MIYVDSRYFGSLKYGHLDIRPLILVWLKSICVVDFHNVVIKFTEIQNGFPQVPGIMP